MRTGSACRAVLAFLVVGLFAVCAQGYTITMEYEQEMLPTDWNTDIGIEKFDPELGILTGVELELIGWAQGNLRAENRIYNPPLGVVLSGQVGAVMDLEMPGADTLIELPSVAQAPETPVQWYDFVPGYTGQDAVDWGLLESEATSDPLVLDAPADLASFTAASEGETLELLLSALSTAQVSSSAGGGVVWEADNIQCGARLQVRYHYVPEPTSLLLLGVGAGACLAYRRRRAAEV